MAVASQLPQRYQQMLSLVRGGGGGSGGGDDDGSGGGGYGCRASDTERRSRAYRCAVRRVRKVSPCCSKRRVERLNCDRHQRVVAPHYALL